MRAFFTATCVVAAMFVASAQVPPDPFLPNEPFPLPATAAQRVLGFVETIPPPPQRYQSRLGWLVAAHIEEQSHWIGSADNQRRIGVAVRQELAALSALSKAERERYLVGLINDTSTWELAQLDNRWAFQVIGAMVIDVAVSAGQARVEGQEQWMKWMDRKMGESYREAAMTTGGSFLSTLGGALFDRATAPGANPIAVIRGALLRQYITSRCGCMNPGPDWPSAPRESVGVRLPPVREPYQTPLGRLAAAWDKPAAGLLQWEAGGRLKREELSTIVAAIKAMAPSERAAYFARFAQDVDLLSKEWSEDQLTNPHVVTGVSFFTSLSAGSAGVLMLNPLAGATLSALGSGALSAAVLSEERALMLQVAALRRFALDEVQKGACECGSSTPSTSSPAASGGLVASGGLDEDVVKAKNARLIDAFGYQASSYEDSHVTLDVVPPTAPNQPYTARITGEVTVDRHLKHPKRPGAQFEEWWNVKVTLGPGQGTLGHLEGPASATETYTSLAPDRKDTKVYNNERWHANRLPDGNYRLTLPAIPDGISFILKVVKRPGGVVTAAAPTGVPVLSR